MLVPVGVRLDYGVLKLLENKGLGNGVVGVVRRKLLCSAQSVSAPAVFVLGRLTALRSAHAVSAVWFVLLLTDRCGTRQSVSFDRVKVVYGRSSVAAVIVMTVRFACDCKVTGCILVSSVDVIDY